MTVKPEGTTTEALTVGELARLAGVTVRTLHHYDEIGLLEPSERGHGGRRAYSAADAARLGRILGYRALDLPLDAVAELLDGGPDEEASQLRHQLGLLDERIAHLTRIRDHVRITLEAHAMSIDLTPEERLEVFGAGNDPAQYDAEVRERWGDTDAYRQSRARTGSYSKEDWVRIKAQGDAIEHALADAMAAGEPATGTAAMDLAERYVAHMSGSYFDDVRAIQRDLAEMWVADPRFRAHYEQRAPGLAEYARAAVLANADRADAADG